MIDEEIETIETAFPGLVKAVNDDGTVDCKAVIRKVSSNGVFDISNPTMPHIPLMKLGGANAEFSFPSKVGDQVLLVAFSRDASRWKVEKDNDNIIPTSCSGLTLNDLVAIPVVRSVKEGAAKIRVNDDGDIVLTPADGRRVISDADIYCKGNIESLGDVKATGEVAAKCQELNDKLIGVVGSTIRLTQHTHNSAVGPTSPSVDLTVTP